MRVDYDEAGTRQVVSRLKELGPTLIVMEASGGLEIRIATELAANGLPVAVINPRQARDFAKATGQLAKTDQVDAAVLAAFAKALQPSLRYVATKRSRPSLSASKRRANHPKL